MSQLHQTYGLSVPAVELFRKKRREATTSGAPIENVLEECKKEWDTFYDTQELANLWLSGYEPIADMVDLYTRIRSVDVKVGLLTNNVLGIFEHLNERMIANHLIDGLDALFDPVVLSYTMGKRKPQDEIYEEAISRLGVSPQQIVFVDDKIENLEPARQLGMTTVLYVNPRHLELSLSGLGLQFPAKGIPLT